MNQPGPAVLRPSGQDRGSPDRFGDPRAADVRGKDGVNISCARSACRPFLIASVRVLAALGGAGAVVLVMRGPRARSAAPDRRHPALSITRAASRATAHAEQAWLSDSLYRRTAAWPTWNPRPGGAAALRLAPPAPRAAPLREAKPSTRTGRAAALTVYFQFLELRHKIERHNLTGRVVECPLDEMNRPRTSVDPQLRIPPAEAEIEQLFAGWRGELATCRKFAPAARNYAAARLAADVGLRINEARMLDLDDVRWELGRFGKLNVRHGKGSLRRGPKPRLVPLINGADRNLRWFVEDVWGQFDAGHARPGALLFPSERKCRDGSCSRATADVFRRSLAEAAARHLPAWEGKLTPHVLRHFCASQLYLAGMSLFAIQELLGHAWTGTTARYIHVHGTHVEDAWVAGQQRAADRWKGLAR